MSEESKLMQRRSQPTRPGQPGRSRLATQPKELKHLLETGWLILPDGAMGTELDRRGAPGRGEANVRDPEVVRPVHESQIEAGCDAIITNTLTMNRLFIESHRLEIDVREVNLTGAAAAPAAAAAARAADGRTVIVLGNLSSTGQLLQPYGPATEHGVTEAFREQAGYLRRRAECRQAVARRWCDCS